MLGVQLSQNEGGTGLMVRKALSYFGRSSARHFLHFIHNNNIGKKINKNTYYLGSSLNKCAVMDVTPTGETLPLEAGEEMIFAFSLSKKLMKNLTSGSDQMPTAHIMNNGQHRK